jgi:hypothetical protein
MLTLQGCSTASSSQRTLARAGGSKATEEPDLVGPRDRRHDLQLRPHQCGDLDEGAGLFCARAARVGPAP